MHWVAKRLNHYEEQLLHRYPHLVDALTQVLVIAVLCSSSLAFAGAAETTSAPNEPSWVDGQLGGWLSDDNLMDDALMIDDTDLSSISGKGAEGNTLNALDSDSKLAIILWDEGRQGNKGGSNHAMSNSAVIKLTVIQK